MSNLAARVERLEEVVRTHLNVDLESVGEVRVGPGPRSDAVVAEPAEDEPDAEPAEDEPDAEPAEDEPDADADADAGTTSTTA